MTDSIKYIRFYFLMNILTLGLTYLFSFIIKFESNYFSNYFLITLFSGVFCSFCVLLLTEIKKYHLYKRCTEDELYTMLLALYKGMTYEIEYSNAHISNKDFPVPQTFYSNSSQTTQQICQKIRFIDYAFLFKENIFMKQLKNFKENELPHIENHVDASIGYLNLAFYMVNYSQLYPFDPIITVLKKEQSDAELRRAKIGNLLDVLSSTYPDRYSWSEDKKAIDSFKFNLEEWRDQNNTFFNK